MSRFNALAERLLEAGVAPRHVRRTVRELEDHLEDLIAVQAGRGYSGEDGYLRARAILGPDEELVAAVIANRRFRSLAARAPWLIFGVLPPVVLFTLVAAATFIMVGLWHLTLADHYAMAPFPSWLQMTTNLWCAAANLGAGPLVAVFFIIAALRQRQRWHWPAVAVVATALVSAFLTFAARFPHHGEQGELSLGFAASSASLWENIGRMGFTMVVVAAVYVLLRARRTAL